MFLCEGDMEDFPSQLHDKTLYSFNFEIMPLLKCLKVNCLYLFYASSEFPRQLQNLFILQYAPNEVLKMVFLPECISACLNRP